MPTLRPELNHACIFGNSIRNGNKADGGVVVAAIERERRLTPVVYEQIPFAGGTAEQYLNCINGTGIGLGNCYNLLIL
ncbi:MAG TPA: hypothetical protein O0X51_07915 [Methanocorpusculum sp.]|nr:hypothetical protein [Methanocorpusculum sp.]